MALADIGIDNATAATISRSVIKYYAIPFTSGGITLRMDVSEGYVYCYVSDTNRHPGPYNYPYDHVSAWRMNTHDYEDRFIDPAQYGRSGTRYVYVAVNGRHNRNSYLMTSASGDFTSQGMESLYLLNSCIMILKLFPEIGLGTSVIDSIDSGHFIYYTVTFVSSGVTIDVVSSHGEVWCYASDTIYNPNSENYTWSFFVSKYNDTYINPASLGRTRGRHLFVTIEGVNISNGFTLTFTTGDTSMTCKSACTGYLLYLYSRNNR